MEHVLIFFIFAQLLLLYFVVNQNFNLVLEKHEALQERDKALKDLDKLKLLNKMKVDVDGKPIIYEEL